MTNENDRWSMIIDPPVGMYSSEVSIQAWIEELKTWESTPDVKDAINEAEEWLRLKREYDSRSGPEESG